MRRQKSRTSARCKSRPRMVRTTRVGPSSRYNPHASMRVPTVSTASYRDEIQFVNLILRRTSASVYRAMRFTKPRVLLRRWRRL